MIFCHPDWTDVDCPQCAVMRACLAQVPQSRPELALWVESTGYGKAVYLTLDNDGGMTWRHDVARSVLTQQVADRLIAWVRWPGDAIDHDWDTLAKWCLQCGKTEEAHALDWSPGACAHAHPLDATPPGELRPAGNYPDEWFESWDALAIIVKWMSVSTPLLRYASAMPDDLDDDLLLVAKDSAKAEGHPVDRDMLDLDDPAVPWTDDPGLWAQLHAWREPNSIGRRFARSIGGFLDGGVSQPLGDQIDAYWDDGDGRVVRGRSE